MQSEGCYVNEKSTDTSWDRTSGLPICSTALFMRWAGHVARMGDRRGVYRLLVGKTEGKRPLGRPRRRWEDKVDL